MPEFPDNSSQELRDKCLEALHLFDTLDEKLVAVHKKPSALHRAGQLRFSWYSAKYRLETSMDAYSLGNYHRVRVEIEKFLEEMVRS